MNERIETVLTALTAAIVFVILVSAVVLVVYIPTRIECNNALENMGREGKYALLGGGCLIETDIGTLVPLNNVRFTEDGRIDG